MFAIDGVPVTAQETLPRPEPPFKGRIGRTAKDSVPDFPREVQPPKNAPNILLILIDDCGFGQYGTFGGGIPSPTMDKLADEGLRYNRFHTTALCSPTRAALITGRNHHSTSFAGITELATGYDGYTCILPRSCGTVGEVLRFVEGPGASKGRARRKAETPFTDMWRRVDHAVSDILDRTTFADLMRIWDERQNKFVHNWEI